MLKIHAKGLRGCIVMLVIGAALVTVNSGEQLSGNNAFAQGTMLNLVTTNASPDGGYNYIVKQDFGTPPDTGLAPMISKLRIFENGKELGAPHSKHSTIRNLGMGRFSHWGGSTGTSASQLYFSASDNTDPRTNGRSYTYLTDSQPTPTPTPTPTSTPGAGDGTIKATNAVQDGSYNYIVKQDFGTAPDTGLAPILSTLRIFENGIELSPAHSKHSAIRSLGMGRFSHWGGSTGTSASQLYFSASDNTDPRTNGRTYTYRIGSQSVPTPPPTPTPTSTPTPTPTPPPTPTPTPTPPPTSTPGPEQLKTNLGVYFEPALPAMGPAGSKVVDQTFGTTILRVTDSSDGADCSVPYSSYPTMNATSTRLYAKCGGTAVFYRFDPVTFTVSNKTVPSSPPGGGVQWYGILWSGTNPDVIYVNSTTTLWAYNVATNTYTKLRDFSAEIAGKGASYLEQGSKSQDDDVFAYSMGSGGGHNSYLVWKRSTNTLLKNVQDPSADEVHLDKSGRYLNVIAITNTALPEIHDLQTGTMVKLGSSSSGNGYKHSDTGMATLFAANSMTGGLGYRSLVTPQTVTPILSGMFGFGNINYSMNANNEQWALVWVQRNDSLNNTQPFENEILQVTTDGSQRVRRIAHHRSKWNEYYDQPNANISRDGKFVAFTSNWGNASGRRDVYVVQVPLAPIN